MQPHFVDEHGVSHPPKGGRQRARTRGGAAVRLVEARSREKASAEHLEESWKQKPTTKPKTPKASSQDLRTSLSAVHLMAKNMDRMASEKESLLEYLMLCSCPALVFRTVPAEPIGSILGSCCLLFRVVLVPTWSPLGATAVWPTG